ncbi:hypothetical protein [Kribbella kalugense]|uniref:hypothetical protein n=1 Tax=Kribbella kalugense TaxID=2512221 RepID=UPI001416EF44|nr:hypothetical protein [Kribbella kalugense]
MIYTLALLTLAAVFIVRAVRVRSRRRREQPHPDPNPTERNSNNLASSLHTAGLQAASA